MSLSESRSEIVMELAEEFLEQYRQGKRPSLKEYIDRHPDLAGEIREVFPAMAMMENIALDDASLENGKSAAAPKTSEVSVQQLGDFRIIREVGRGGMGVVYEAEQVSLGRHVALKVLPQKALLDAKQKRRFEREAKSAARLHHTNIVPIFGVGEHDGLPYYVMQFIQGLGLDEVMDELKRLQPVSGSETGGELRVSRKDAPAAGAPAAGAPAADVARSLLTGQFQGTMEFSDPNESDADKRDATADSAERARHDKRDASSGTGRLSDSFTLSSSSVTLPGQSDDSHASIKKPTYWQSVAQIGAQVADALEYAHKQGILHRDIKPSNLLLDTRGTVWVTDFGLAKADDQQNITHTGDILGTLRYMPPEAFEGRTDSRSDVYSLGLSLYELLAMQPAFDEKDRNKLIKQVMSTEAARLDRINPAIPRDLVTIVHKAIDHEPGRRYQTAAELSADLHRFIEDEPIKARRLALYERTWRWCRRNPVVAGLTAALVLILVGVTTASLLAAAHFDRLYDQEAATAVKERQAREAALQAKQEADKNFRDAQEQRKLAEANADKHRQAMRAYNTSLNNYLTTIGKIPTLKVRWFGDFRRPLLDLDALFKGDQDNPVFRAGLASAYMTVAQIHAESGDHEDARNATEKARKLLESLAQADPADVDIQRALADAYHASGLRLGRTAEARELLSKALAFREKLAAKEPKNLHHQKDLAETLLALADLDWHAGRLKEGAQARRRGFDMLRVALDGEPKNVAVRSKYAVALRATAEAYAQAGLWKEVAKQFHEYLNVERERQHEDHWSSAWRIAACLDVITDDDAGYRETCNKVLQQFGKSNSPNVCLHVAEVCSIGSGGGLEGAKLAEIAVNAAAHGKGANGFFPALAYYRAGQFDQAITHAAAGGIMNFPVLAMAHHRLGHTAEARKYLQQSTGQWQHYSPLARQIDGLQAVPVWPGWADWVAFLTLYREASQLITGSPPVEELYGQVHRGWLYSRLGEKEKSEAEFQAAAAVNLKDSSELLARARLFVEVGQHSRAQADFDKAVEQDLKAPQPRIARGRYYAERGRDKEAEADFTAVAARRPEELNHFLEAGWWAAGPYPEDLALPCPPEKMSYKDLDPSRPVAASIGTGSLPWQPLVKTATTEHATVAPSWINLGPVTKGNHRSSYAFTFVYAEKEMTATLFVSADDNRRIWLNGQLVDENPNCWGAPHRIPVTFRAGRNVLLAKVCNGRFGGTGFLIRIADSPLDQAEIYAQLGLWKEAAAEFRKAGKLPDDPWTWYRCAYVLLRAGDVAGYRQTCQDMLDKWSSSNHHNVLSAAASACVLADNAVSDVSAIVRTAQKADSRERGNAFLVFGMGAAHYRAGNFDEAIETCTRSLNTPWFRAEVEGHNWLVLAMAHHRKGEKDKAKEWWQKAEKWFAQPTAESKRREHWVQLFYKEAATSILGAKDDGKEKAEQARMRERLKNFGEATKDYDLALLLEPDDARLLLARGRRLFELKRAKEAEADFARAIKPDGDPQQFRQRGRAYADLGLLDKAAADFDNALELGARDANLLPTVFHYDLVPRGEDFLARVVKRRPDDEELGKLVKARETNVRDSGPAGVEVKGNLLKNGSFEEGPDPGRGYVIHKAGSATLPGWSISRGDIDVMALAWQAAHGARCLDLDGTMPGSIAQTIATVPGRRYRLTFDLAGNPGGETRVKRLRVAAAGQSADFAFDTFGHTGWVGKTWEFTAEKDSTTLEFQSLDDSGGFGPFLDNIAVVAVGK